MAMTNGAVAQAHGLPARKSASRRRKRARSQRGTQGRLSARARHMTHEAWGELRDSASELAEGGQAKVHIVERALKKVIGDRPLKSALIGMSFIFAAGAGVLIGRMWPATDRFPRQ